MTKLHETRMDILRAIEAEVAKAGHEVQVNDVPRTVIGIRTAEASAAWACGVSIKAVRETMTVAGNGAGHPLLFAYPGRDEIEPEWFDRSLPESLREGIVYFREPVPDKGSDYAERSDPPANA